MKTIFPRFVPLPLWLCLLVLAPLLFLQPAQARAAAPAEPLPVFVSILPQEYFVERIGGDRVRVQALVKPGQDPHTFAPTPQQMAQLAGARIYFRIGVPFENAMIPRLSRSIPDLRVIDLQEGMDLLEAGEAHDDHHNHGDDLDPHTWLDPLLALRQAVLIRDTLISLDPEGARAYTANFALLAADLQELDRTLRELLQPMAGRTIYVFHPAYGYFCRAYGLKQKAINPGGKQPGARQLARLIEEAEADKVRFIFSQPQFSEKAAATIARSIGATVVTLDPLARDYLANMHSIAAQLAASLPENGQ
ncbi:MAG: zinc ABC transporter substrate-binding protein [Desulfobulbaceae bacterium]|jgi:zinc transport system substrate-binding protein|nr:zinc ABC transporter substrate-binding protein [Desulfobulbaceae bacterium]